VTQHPPEIDRYIRRQLPDLHGKHVLDVGCGRGGIGFLLRTQPGGDAAHIVGVDVHEPYLEFCARFGLYDELIHGDAATLRFGQFDVVTACEVVEHIQADKSAALLDRLEQIAKERIIVSTPNGDNRRGPVGGVESEAHISIWTPSWFKRRGYQVRGVGSRWCRFDQAGRIKMALWYVTTPLAIRFPWFADTLVASKEGHEGSR
jgi:SAM-dependent methyltransferase